MRHTSRSNRNSVRAILALALSAGCFSPSPAGLAPATPAKTVVKFDLYHTPLPVMPLPNDAATRFDPTSPTGLRVNASLVAPSEMSRRERKLIDQLDGWGSFQPITIPFTGPIDVTPILNLRKDPHYDLNSPDNVVYVINVDPKSPHFKQISHLDWGRGNFPVVLHTLDNYWKNDNRVKNISLPFEEYDEDTNHNGVLDLGSVDAQGNVTPPEDTDADGILDQPNYLPGTNVDVNSPLKDRADALMTFYDKETNELVARPMEALDERTKYAVVITKRLKDVNGESVGSPYAFINDASQTEELAALPEALPAGLTINDVAFAFAFTTESTDSDFQAVRDGLYGHGVQQQLGEQFPAEVGQLLPMRDSANFPHMTNQYVVYGEQWAAALKQIAAELLGAPSTSEVYRATADSMQYVDYIVIGSYQSPQLFNRYDKDGNWLPLDAQVWPADLSTKPVQARSETVYFTLVVPRKEVSVRGQGKPAPVVIAGHGYGSNRFEGLQMGPYFAKYGYATFAIDGPGHGLGISKTEKDLAITLLQGYGLGPMATGIFSDRAINQDNSPDGSVDSGADFWTAYLFHTRDVVRQYELDLMQGIRVLRSFDGQQQWKFDVKDTGKPGLAGDFDGDGVVDVDGPGPMAMLGGSLGGIMSMLTGSVEPHVKAIVPISGGGGLSDMGLRTVQGGAVEGFILRAMGPLYVGTLDGSGNLALETVVPNMNRADTEPVATVAGVKAWDTMIVENLANGARGCGFVNADGTVRVGVESDKGDATRITIYSGPQLAGDEHCGLKPGADAAVKKVVDTWQAKDVQFQWDKQGNPIIFKVGTPLVALADGLGLRRGHPDLRRFQALAQLVMDPGDPGVYAKHLQKEPLVYPGTGEQTGAHAIVITTMGDNAVPANSGTAFARNAGLVDYLNDDPRYGKPPNQVLLENHQQEAECEYSRYTAAQDANVCEVPEAPMTQCTQELPQGHSLCEDLENFSQGTDMWGGAVPRLSQPLRLGWDKKDPLGGVSVALFPYPQPAGQHGFDLPGTMTDQVRNDAHCSGGCKADLPATDLCSCQAPIYDIGYFMFNMIGRWLKSGSAEIHDDLCQAQNNCPNNLLPAAPPSRSGADIDDAP